MVKLTELGAENDLFHGFHAWKRVFLNPLCARRCARILIILSVECVESVEVQQSHGVGVPRISTDSDVCVEEMIVAHGLYTWRVSNT